MAETHVDVGLDKMAEKPGQKCWTATWDEATNSYTIVFESSWWGPTGDTMVVVGGIAMKRRDADIMMFGRRLNEIAKRPGPKKPVRFE